MAKRLVKAADDLADSFYVGSNGLGDVVINGSAIQYFCGGRRILL